MRPRRRGRRVRDGPGDGSLRDDDNGCAMAGPRRADAWAARGVRGAGAAECVINNLGKLRFTSSVPNGKGIAPSKSGKFQDRPRPPAYLGIVYRRFGDTYE